jgi:putative restriction endonuclease
MNEKRQQIIKKVENLNMWRRGEERAPHKPLLLLLALAHAVQGRQRLVTFNELEEPLTYLLKNYGPPRHVAHPEYPFWRLQNDGLWEVSSTQPLKLRASNSDPRKSELKTKQVKGGLPLHLYEECRKSDSFVVRLTSLILTRNFPTSMHEDILAQVGLPISISSSRRRDSQFRAEVISAYERRCAVCGYDLKVGLTDLALEAAHIKWYQAGGPDSVDNGLALCTVHHKALDRGAIGVSDDYTVLVSTELNGHQWFYELFESFKGKKLRMPTRREWSPKKEFIRWHSNQVFRKPARD